jgi:hypothetical protein
MLGLLFLCLTSAKLTESKTRLGPSYWTANYLGNGFDYVSGTYSLAPLFTFTYNQNQTWQSPYSRKTYMVPDQMFIHGLDETFESVCQSISNSFEEFYSSYISRYTFTIGIDKIVGFNFDKQIGFIRNVIVENFEEIIHGTHYWAFAIGSMYPAYMLELNPMFNSAVNKFPQQIQTKRDFIYATEFTQTFGQFYVYRSAFGAQLDFNVALSETLVQKYSREWDITQASLKFHYDLFDVSAGGFENQTSIHIDKEFLAQTKSNTTFYGGDPALANLSNLDPWVKSIDQNLFPLNATFIPIWTLVSDPTKQSTMKSFMLDYIKKKSFALNLETLRISSA